MSKMFSFLLAIGITSIAGAYAQQPPVNPNAPSNPAVTTPAAPAPAAMPGANSFTEGQAKLRIENDGYTAVTGLNKDANGIWQATATKGGQNVHVSVDYQGNIVAR
ncbi:MAG: PepSY domain-containing protein [Beijerinckiaceae bacterium]|nr:PepSY domain-containing protein [Beijerinckiaceae bacterium]MCZ8300383.1 PepSY domain-containing protein [Beijerinckiaceae bacterium]